MKNKKIILTLLLLVSFKAMSNANEALMNEIKNDLLFSMGELSKKKKEFVDEYLEKSLPVIKNMNFDDLTIHKLINASDSKSGNELIIASNINKQVWGDFNLSKLYIYIIENKNGIRKISDKLQLDPNQTTLYTEFNTVNSTTYGLDKSFQFFKPIKGDVFVFQQYITAASGHLWNYHIIQWDDYENEFFIVTRTLPFGVLPNPCEDGDLVMLNCNSNN